MPNSNVNASSPQNPNHLFFLLLLPLPSPFFLLFNCVLSDTDKINDMINDMIAHIIKACIILIQKQTKQKLSYHLPPLT